MTPLYCTIEVSEDRQSVYLSLHQAEETDISIPLDSPTVAERLSEAGIVFGINQEVIDNAVEYFHLNPTSSRKFLVASGTAGTVAGCPVNLLFIQAALEYEQENDEGIRDVWSLVASPLVCSGRILAEPLKHSQQNLPLDVYGAPSPPPPDPQEPRAIPGDNVEYCSDTGVFKSTASGYPTVEQYTENEVELHRISVSPALVKAPDAMSARLCLQPHPPGAPPPTLDDISSMLDQEQIIYGRLTSRIQQCLENVILERRPVEVTAALGLRPRDGEDAKLRFMIEVGPLPGTIRGDGSIDFRERKMFVGVGEGQLIAVKIPPTQGKAGKNILGEEIAPKPGKDLSIKVSDDASYDPDTGEIRASRAGVLSMVTEHSVKVCAKQIVSGDVDYNTGNIISRDAVEINGSIRPNFKVIAGGDITISGNVEKAGLRSDANIIIKGGVVGSRSRIHARGEVDISFLEHGRVFAGKNIILRKSCYYCRLHTWRDFFSPPDSRLIASQIIAAGSLTVGHVGSENADITMIGAAIDPERLQRHYDLRRDEIAKIETYAKIRRQLGDDSLSTVLAAAKKECKAVGDALARLNLIPETPLGEDKKVFVQLPQEVIIVHGTICRGTEIRIGNTSTILEQSLSKVKFRLTYECKGERGKKPKPKITATPLDGKTQEDLLCL